MRTNTAEGQTKSASVRARDAAQARRRARRERALGAAHAPPLPPSTPSGPPDHPRIAVLDGDRGFLLVLDNRLRSTGFEHVFMRRAPTPAALAEQALDALVVDVEMLGADRLDWLAEVCELCPRLAVLVCTRASTVAERVRALRAGIADWLGKPCHPEELIARVEAITLSRRSRAKRDLRPMLFGELEIRPDQFQAYAAECSLALTRREYRLLELLARADGEALSREQLYESVWGHPMARNDRSVDVFVHKLRGKLKSASPRFLYIHTEFRFGYRLAVEPVDGVSAFAVGELDAIPLDPGARVAELSPRRLAA